jgi:hypoxia up-regulated 1
VLFPIEVDFERVSEDSGKKQVKRSLFARMNPFPQKKIMTFNKHVGNFDFNVNFDELEHLSNEEIL